MKTVLTALALSTVMATAALAGNPAPIIPQAPVAAATTWDGFYLGALYSSYSATEIYQGVIEDYNIGGFAGYNFQRGSLVFGGEIAYAMGDYDTTDPAILEAIVGFTGDVSVLDLKARVGFAISDAAMVYGFAGGTSASIDNSGTVADFSGFNYGAGVAYQFNNGMLLGVEYVARDLDGKGIALGETLTADAVEARVGWQF